MYGHRKKQLLVYFLAQLYKLMLSCKTNWTDFCSVLTFRIQQRLINQSVLFFRFKETVQTDIKYCPLNSSNYQHTSKMGYHNKWPLVSWNDKIRKITDEFLQNRNLFPYWFSLRVGPTINKHHFMQKHPENSEK